MATAPSRPRGHGAAMPAQHAAKPLTDGEMDELQTLLDGVPPPLEPLDVSMLDGYLCGVLVQPAAVPLAQWLAHVTDVDARPLPAGFDAARLHALVGRRHAELEAAIGRRQWFDPWVFELAPDPHAEPDEAPDEEDTQGAPGTVADAVYPWVAGFATALELFPGLMAWDAAALNEPLALVYQHLHPDDLEDADALQAEIESLEPPQDLGEAVESLVRAVLLLADVARPLPGAGAARPRRPGRRR